MLRFEQERSKDKKAIMEDFTCIGVAILVNNNGFLIILIHKTLIINILDMF